jgi:hypothetical protein
MCPVQSIICYAGGTGGDFLKSMCLQQLNSEEHTWATIAKSGQAIFKDLYFKQFCIHDYTRPDTDQLPLNLDLTKINPIENSHYYFNWFSKLTNKVYFIDYPEHCTAEIIKIYIQKEQSGDITRFINYHKNTLPEWAQSKLTEDNAIQIFSTQWIKQLNIWRAMSSLTPIDIKKFFSLQEFQQLIENLIDQSITDIDKFNSTYSKWIKYNTRLKNLLS